jgi:hypothetical protein
MAITPKLLNEVVTFTRGTGKTRTNSAGLIVGVDFSSTSNTVTTGSKTFTLAADANVNRDWVVGSSVRAVDQVGGGAMVGTVTSYTPSTQELVIEVATVTGTGTGTNWRIGSLEMTRDVLTGAVSSEPAATNLRTSSEEILSPAYPAVNSTLTQVSGATPFGSSGALAKFSLNSGANTGNSNEGFNFNSGITLDAGATYSQSIFVKPDGATLFRLRSNVNGQVFDVPFVGAMPAPTGAIVSVTRESLANGFFRITWSFVSISTVPGNRSDYWAIKSDVADGTSGFFVTGAQLELNAPTSYIPTTTAQVTRAADSFALTSSALTAIRQGQGTLYVEAESADVGPTQKRALRLSGPTGDIRLAKRGVGNFSGFTKMLEVDNDLYFGATAGNSQRCNGKEMGSFQAAVNERTGVSETIANVSAWAYDGTNQIAYAGGNTEERFLTKDLALWSGKGFGALGVGGGIHTGTRFVFTSSEVAGVVFLSEDGITWRRKNTAVITQPQAEVAFANLGGGISRLVSVGNAGTIFTSDDNGETWVARTSGTTNNLNGALFAFNLFVAGQASGAPQAVRTSPDGITWTARTLPGSIGVNDNAFNGTNLVVSVGNGGYIATTPDLVTWTQRTSGVTGRLRGVYFAAGQWVVVGDAGTILTSPDGITWTSRTSGTTQQLNEVNFFNNLFIVGGNLGTVLTSPDGITWTSRAGNTNVSNLIGIATSANRLVITGSSGAVTTSEDGITYTNRTNNNQFISGMAFGNGVFVSTGNATGGSGYIATIDSAGNYTRRVSNSTNSVIGVRFINGAFYATYQAQAGVASVWRSVDGITWSAAGTLVNVGCTDVAFGNGVYVASRNANSEVVVSADGVSFNANTNTGLTPSVGFNGIAFANGIFVVVGGSGVIGTSTNGTTWTLRTSGTTASLTSVMYSVRDQLWYAAGAAGTLLASEDAITWRSVQNAGFASIDNTTLQATELLPVWQNGKNKIAISYKQNQVIASLNGVSVSDATATIPTITAGALAENLNGLVHKVQFFPEALTDAEIKALTGV